MTPVGRDFRDQLVRGVDWRNADLRGADLRGARLQDVDLRGADLRGADLRDVLAMRSSVLLDEADLEGCDLREADFSGAHAPGLQLANANLEGSRWDGADLTGAVLSRARMGWQSTFIANVAGHRNSRRAASFDDVTLADGDLGGAQLPGISLRRADLRGVSAVGAMLADADLREANLCGGELRSADLCGADLTSSVLAHADLGDTALIETQFRDADVAGLRLTGARIGATGFAVRAAAGEDSNGRVPGEPDVSQCVRLAPDYGSSIRRSALIVVDGGVRGVGEQVAALVEKAGLTPFTVSGPTLSATTSATFLSRAAASNDVTVVVYAAGRIADWAHLLRRNAVDRPRWSKLAFAFVEVPAVLDRAVKVTVNLPEAATELGWLHELARLISTAAAEHESRTEIAR